MISKSDIRSLYKKNRLLLTKGQAQEKATIVANNFIENFALKNNNFLQKEIAFYCPINNEVDPISIADFYQKVGSSISLPKISRDNKVLEFRRRGVNSELLSNSRYKELLEPDCKSELVIPDIVFVPLVSFNESLYRIGMGGGFYDSTIKHYRSRNLKTKFIGLGYDSQFCKDFVCDKWDQKLDFVVSETQIWR